MLESFRLSAASVAPLLFALTIFVVGALSALAQRRDQRIASKVPPVSPDPVPASAEARASRVPAALGSLRPGDALDRWSIADIREMDRGAIPVVLATADGTRFELEILRHDPGDPEPLASAGTLSVYLALVQQGTRTPEEIELAARVLAEALGRDDVAAPASLLTFGQRAPLL